jgi:hypothetical protein
MQAEAARPARRGCGWVWAGLALIGAAACCALAVLGALLVRDQFLPPTPADQLRADLNARVAEADAVWGTLDDLWGRLEAGQTVACGEAAIPHPYFVAWRSVDRNAYPALAELADETNLVLRELHRAADLWTEVCQGGAVEIAPETATEARQALARAADRLTTLLTLQNGSVRPDGQ